VDILTSEQKRTGRVVEESDMIRGIAVFRQYIENFNDKATGYHVFFARVIS